MATILTSDLKICLVFVDECSNARSCVLHESVLILWVQLNSLARKHSQIYYLN